MSLTLYLTRKMDEKLKAVLHKVVQLTRQNPEFNTELRKALEITPSVTSASLSDGRINHIEKYLGLDYYVDGQPSLVDYSFVAELDVRAQLISDNREMMRFRYGTRYHAINFEEYCRYALLQGEMLLNYFYDKKHSTIREIIEHIQKYNPTARIKADLSSLSEISFNVKFWAFEKEFSIEQQLSISWNNIRKVRNTLSHRSVESDEMCVSNYKKKLIAMNLPLAEDGYVKTTKLVMGSTEYNLYHNMVKNDEDYRKYLYLIWLSKKPFNEVFQSLNSLAIIVKSNI